MTTAEFKAVQEIKRLIWQKLFSGNPPEGTWKESQYTDVEIAITTFNHTSQVANASSKSIKRFIELTENDDLDNIRSKYPLALFAHDKKITEPIDSTFFQGIVNKFESEKNPLHPYQGTYKIFFIKKTKQEFDMTKTFGEIQVLSNAEAKFFYKNTRFDGKVILKGTNLFCRFKNKSETIYLIIKVGNSKNQDLLTFLSGLMLAVRDKDDMPFSTIVALMKQPNNFADVAELRIKKVFEYIRTHPVMEIDHNILSFLDIDISLENALSHAMTEEEKHILQFKGTWIVYYIGADRETIQQGILKIVDKHNVRFKNQTVNYPNGSVTAKGSDFYINVDSNVKMLSMTISPSYQNQNYNNEIIGTFTTIGRATKKPICGSIILEKISDDIIEKELLDFDKNSELYKEWEASGKLAKLATYEVV